MTCAFVQKSLALLRANCPEHIAQDEANRVKEITLPRTISPDDAIQPVIEINHGLFAVRLKPFDDDLFDVHRARRLPQRPARVTRQRVRSDSRAVFPARF